MRPLVASGMVEVADYTGASMWLAIVVRNGWRAGLPYPNADVDGYLRRSLSVSTALLCHPRIWPRCGIVASPDLPWPFTMNENG